MCIRDSYKAAALRESTWNGIFGLIACGIEPENIFIQSWVCLLYTSDAADERSSVDLGGRRIIKKKIQKL